MGLSQISRGRIRLGGGRAPSEESVGVDRGAEPPYSARFVSNFLRKVCMRHHLLAPAALLGIVALGWCAATATWSLADLARPPAYLEDPSRADIIAVYAGLTAGAEGEATPFFWKRVERLNAPFEANWTDWPSLDELHSLVLVLLARLFGIFAGLKLTLLLGHLLAAVTFFGVARVSGSSPLWSFVGGLAFGLAPFLFAQSPHHSGVQWAWHVPLFTLVWRWAVTDPGIEPGSMLSRTCVRETSKFVVSSVRRWFSLPRVPCPCPWACCSGGMFRATDASWSPRCSDFVDASSTVWTERSTRPFGSKASVVRTTAA